MLGALGLDLACAVDPVRFARSAGIEPDPWQARVLRDSNPRILLNCSRQAGKSTITAVLAAHQVVYEPDSLVLLLSPSLRQSGELFKKAAQVYRDAGRPVATVAESALQVQFANGSRIISLPSDDRIRGYSGVALLAVDEASRVPDSLIAVVRPMLAVSGGRLIGLSTPWGRRGWWHAEWVSDRPWSRYEVPAEQCPRISPEFLAEEREALGHWLYSQEYGCQFVDAEGQPFRWDDVEAAFSEGVEQWAV